MLRMVPLPMKLRIMGRNKLAHALHIPPRTTGGVMNSTSAYVAAAAGSMGRVDAAIRQAAARSGVDFSYLYNQARLESSLNPNARARTSSATGLFQFVDQTWLATIDRHGAANGLAWAANAVQRGSNGRYHVSDPTLRRQIMELRRNPEAASAMAAEFANDNRAHLERRLGREMEPVDLYLAHFLGAGGATRFLRAHEASPNAAAAARFPDAARANRSVFFKRDGSARSFNEIRNMMAARLGTSGPMPAATPRPVSIAANENPAERLAALQAETETGAAAVSPRHARLAYMLLADMSGDIGGLA